mmetsp:Transcript_107119/g.255735  ORF Transcript_107119/g.255735 Transcript_107119/m.255735 type:complete len:207 (-) Transcript_107119:3725-4345(-)
MFCCSRPSPASLPTCSTSCCCRTWDICPPREQPCGHTACPHWKHIAGLSESEIFLHHICYTSPTLAIAQLHNRQASFHRCRGGDCTRGLPRGPPSTHALREMRVAQPRECASARLHHKLPCTCSSAPTGQRRNQQDDPFDSRVADGGQTWDCTDAALSLHRCTNCHVPNQSVSRTELVLAYHRSDRCKDPRRSIVQKRSHGSERKR